ncbi:hypothetical protein TRVL_05871 [Trypanosoma vivax]|nr:hypothetical protein TRVL_05871 [Trypanosoma vivax]
MRAHEQRRRHEKGQLSTRTPHKSSTVASDDTKVARHRSQSVLHRGTTSPLPRSEVALLAHRHASTSAQRAIGLATCQCKYSLGTKLRLVTFRRVSRLSGTLHALPARNLRHGQYEQAHQVNCWGHHANVTQWSHGNSGAASRRANEFSSRLISWQRAASSVAKTIGS